MSEPIRIQKYLSEKGILSRRKAEAAIKDGLIKLNGEVVVEMGIKIDPKHDKVEVDDALLNKIYTYLSYYKPRGIVTNCPQNDEEEIIDLLPSKYKELNSVGRLDKASEGLILLTDDGVFANQILNRNVHYKRVYKVRTNEPLTLDEIKDLEAGVTILDGVLTKPCIVIPKEDKAYIFEMTEGKNRQIRRMVETTDKWVTHLKRLQFGPLNLNTLKPGEFRPFKPEQFK